MSLIISRVYTGVGDKGQTKLSSGQSVDKDDARIEAYGTVDELGAVLGVAIEAIRVLPEGDARDRMVIYLKRIQNELFDLGSELSYDGDFGKMPVVSEGQVKRLEAEIDAENKDLPKLRSFILAGGGLASATLHQARTVCRRAERRVVSLGKAAEIRPEVRRYLNRLSDLLFVLGRVAARHSGEDEVLWEPGRVEA